MADVAPPLQDPVELLPPLCSNAVFTTLGPQALARAACVCSAWRSLASEPAFYEPACAALWAGKAYTPAHLLLLNARLAYVASSAEVARQVLTKEELCEFTWTFAFRNGGPGGWFPGQAFRRYFHADFSVDTRPANEFWVEPRRWSFRFGGGVQYVQVNEYPPMKVSRRPDWGWRIESQWVTMTSDHPAGPNPGKEALALKPTEQQQPQGAALAYYYVWHAQVAGAAADAGLGGGGDAAAASDGGDEAHVDGGEEPETGGGDGAS